MAGLSFLRQVSGVITEILGIQTSAGAGDAGKIAALDSTGRWDISMMPVGIVAETATIVASEALSAGAWVNIWNSSGAFKARNADATVAGKHAHGFVLSAVSSAANATVYLPGNINTQVSGQTPGDVFLTTTPGVGSATPPSGSGNVIQQLGVATSATSVDFSPKQPITLA